jgi:phospholipid:diacylglycerol acyltransferase
MAAFLSGEMKDTVQMNPAGTYGEQSQYTGQLPRVDGGCAVVLERFFSRAERRKLFLSWAGSASMWIKVGATTYAVPRQAQYMHQGGNTIWGNLSHAPDDDHGSNHTHGELIAFRHSLAFSAESSDDKTSNMTSEQAGTWILQHTPSTFQVAITLIFIYPGVLTIELRGCLQQTTRLDSSATRNSWKRMISIIRSGAIRSRSGTYCSWKICVLC